MIIHDKNTYFQILEKFEIVPYTQSRGWYEMHSMHKPERIKFFVNDKENPTIACFAHERKLFGIKIIFIEDEAYKNASAYSVDKIRSFYEEINRLGYNIIEVNSNSLYNFDYEIALRQAGYLRPVGLFSLPSTKIIDLTQTVEYSRDWKKNIKKANKKELHFEPLEKVTKQDCDEFIAIFAEMGRAKSLPIPFSAEMLENLCSTGEFKMIFVSRDGVRIAATIIYMDSEMGLSLYAASSSMARKTSASYFMYNELFKYLNSVGVLVFDMGKLLPSTKSVNNVFLFKNGIQGTHIQLNGEWGRYSNSLLRSGMYFVKKHLLKKNEI